jgi:hypothetical protein
VLKSLLCILCCCFSWCDLRSLLKMRLPHDISEQIFTYWCATMKNTGKHPWGHWYCQKITNFTWTWICPPSQYTIWYLDSSSWYLLLIMFQTCTLPETFALHKILNRLRQTSLTEVTSLVPGTGGKCRTRAWT